MLTTKMVLDPSAAPFTILLPSHEWDKDKDYRSWPCLVTLQDNIVVISVS